MTEFGHLIAALINASKLAPLFALIVFFSAGEASGDMVALKQGIRTAVESGRLVRISLEDEKSSEADVLIAKSRMLPSVNATLSGTSLAYQPAAIFGTMTVPMSEKDFITFGVNVQQTLYDFEGNASRLDASRALVRSRKLDTLRIKNLAAIEFALAYFDLLEADKMVKLAENELERLQTHLKDAKALFEAGTITKNDVLQAEVKISDAKQRLTFSVNARAVGASRLNKLLSRPLNSDIQVEDIPETAAPAAAPDMEAAWNEALSKRAEILMVEETVKALDLESTAKKSEFMPKIFVRGSYDYTENMYQAHEDNWGITLGMSVNLFSGGSTKAEISKLQHEKAKLLERKNLLIDDIRLEVRKYFLDMKSASDRLDAAKDAVTQAEENYRINKLRYEEGVGTATEALDAAALLTTAETNRYRAIYDLKKAEAASLYAVGKDLTEVY